MTHVNSSLLERFVAVRARSVELAAPLTVEDQLVQPMPDASPTKWHLAHTTWFFETIVLGTSDPEFNFLFNSYYEALGPRVERARRGMLSRPSLEFVHRYRAEVDERTRLPAESLISQQQPLRSRTSQGSRDQTSRRTATFRGLPARKVPLVDDRAQFPDSWRRRRHASPPTVRAQSCFTSPCSKP
jgi:hypothetical protein